MSATAAKANTSTTKTFTTSLVTNVILLVVEVGAFTYLKQRLGRVYQPRTYLPPPDKRAEELPKGIWRWIPAVLWANPKTIIHKNGLDAYMFLRWLRMMIIVFFVFTVITWPVLLPVDSANVKGHNDSGVGQLSWGNITNSLDDRYAAHIIVVYLLTFFLFFMIRQEMLHFIHMRHQYLISKSHSHQARARTVLVTALPDEFGDEHNLREFASFVPGGINHLWIYRDSTDLNKRFAERAKACQKLETACSKLLREATKAWAHRQSAHTKEVKQEVKQLERERRKSQDVDVEKRLEEVNRDPLKPAEASGGFLQDLVPEAKRPKHRIGKLSAIGIGRKVDTIEYCKTEVGRLNAEIEESRVGLGQRKSLGAAFIECNLQLGAHVLAQCVSYHEPLKMADKWVEISPKDVIWANLDDGAFEMRTRYVTSMIATLALIVIWAFPVAFIGTLSNLDGLCQEAKWLRWVCTIPSVAQGILRGVLPPVLLALLMILLPVILRGLAWYECIPLHSLVDISLYKRYYAFLVIHGFLIVTITSGITAAIQQIVKTPAQAVGSLASNLPNASIFFLTYMTTQGLSGAASALIQLGPLIVHFVKKWFLGRTPRQAYGVTFLMPAADFGTILPRLSLLATIGMAYSVISPLINGLALVAFCLFFLAWKFLFTQVFDQPEESETGGLYFPIAISNLFVGLYIEQICLACLFFLKIPSAGARNVAGPIAEGVLMLVLLAITVAVHGLIRNSFKSITEYLPMSLATKKMAQRYSGHPHHQHGGAPPIPLPASVPGAAGINKAEEEVVDLFSRDRLKSVLRRRVRPVKKLIAPKKAAKDEEKHAEETNEGVNQVNGTNGHRSSIEKQPLPVADTYTRGSSSEHKEPNSAGKPEPGDIPGTEGPAGTASQVLQDAKEMDSPRQERQDRDKEGEHVRQKAPGDAREEEYEEEFEQHAFDHPSTYEAQTWVWVPKDEFGFSTLLVEELKRAGVDASDEGATMDWKGTVEVSRNPPDEEWSGGQDK